MILCDSCTYCEIIKQNKFCLYHSAYIGWHGCECGKPKPLTNYDRLVSKSPEELAEWLDNVSKAWYDEGFTKDFDEPLMSEFPATASEWLGWLQQEAE